MCHGQMIDLRHQKARKVHQCDCCRGFIQPGERYEYQVQKDGGDFTTWKGCKNCVVHVSLLFKRYGYDACYFGQYEGAREDAQMLGWRAYLAEFRQARKNIFS